ncbi:ATP-binding cassette domain-containing protein [Maridesulfovibrio hydrothermalis]|uniref:Molybdate/tungstate import ATP-binding protein WtpC n=1 Tax=Maridesulfovibrio hydrothermalis AM13 = DSM 14728 TaxID=1121451 RepID=L0R913_9BACT|nr:ATP-binding cassette domain-containing protein [Maridesulfovibrio hydrothermalis]CCO22712.1 Molybdate/tungstate import ATP-binding protein WtpC [Maridesulfovibrio hydrothermalis AM13 = DSM 14728]
MTLTLNIRKQLPNFMLDVSLTCAPGTLTAIVGPSGAGKSTLVRIIAGLERPDEGIISFDDTLWNDTSINHFATPQNRGLGLVFQEYTLFPHLNVYKNVAFAAVDKNCVQPLLEKFGIEHIAESKPCNISGGERQRAAFCQALAREPVLLLLDEPFSALDIATREGLRTELLHLKNELNIPMIHVTHDLEEAYYLADSIFVMENGCAAPQWLERQSRRHRPPVPEMMRYAV